MITTLEKFIDGSNYTVTQFPARRAIRLKAKLIKLFGPVLAQVFLTTDTKTSDDQKKSDLIKAVELLACSIDENQFENLAIELLASTRKNGVELTGPNIDLEFAGDMAALYQVMWFVVEANFSNFFSMMGIGSLFSTPNQTKTDDTKRTFKRN